jgi:hypothetical protein
MTGDVHSVDANQFMTTETARAHVEQLTLAQPIRRSNRLPQPNRNLTFPISTRRGRIGSSRHSAEMFSRPIPSVREAEEGSVDVGTASRDLDHPGRPSPMSLRRRLTQTDPLPMALRIYVRCYTECELSTSAMRSGRRITARAAASLRR